MVRTVSFCMDIKGILYNGGFFLIILGLKCGLGLQGRSDQERCEGFLFTFIFYEISVGH